MTTVVVVYAIHESTDKQGQDDFWLGPWSQMINDGDGTKRSDGKCGADQKDNV